MSKLFEISVKENKRLTKDHYLLTAHPLTKVTKPKPGQFFMLSVDNRLDPLLKRPFSLHRFGGDLQFLYRVVGRGTGILKEKKAGDILEIMGPFGNGFPIENIKDKKIILVAGGLGIAPIFSLAEAITKLLSRQPGTKENFPNKRNPLLFYGARTRREILCKGELKSIGINPIISTEDGTSGQKGRITNLLLRKFLTHHSSLITHYCFYACGSKQMLKALSSLAGRYNLKGYITVEENMACGVGTCLGCVINTKNGYKRVCKEGPVFSIDEIVW